MTDHGWTGRHKLVSLVRDRLPDGFQLEVRHDDAYRVTDYRYTRLSDGLSCQQRVSDLLAEQAVSLSAVAEVVTKQMLDKYAVSGG